jgi:NAD(P) transhydrogenase
VEFNYDVIVIGSGPGGEGAAMKSAKEGKRVAMVEEMLDVGGNCTHRGTIPSKALRQAIQQLAGSQKYPGENYQMLLRTAESVIERQVKMRHGFYERNDVDLIPGRAEFTDPHTIKVTFTNELPRSYTAAAFVVATGARPYHPPDVDFSHPRILDSDTVLKLTETPRSMTIYGAGVIGCEYTSIFRA